MVRRSTFSNRAQLYLTQLDARDVPAGGVVAEQIGGTLFITGDNFDNSVAVTANADGVKVEGIQTAINGTAGPAVFAGVARIEVIGGDGDDHVQASLWQTVGELRIDTGSGRDAVSLITNSRSDVIIDTGDGADVVYVLSSGYDEANLQIVTGDGADRVGLNLRNHAWGAVRVDTGNGNDDVEAMFEASQSGGSLSIFTGNGNDTVTLHTTPGGVDVDLTIDGGHGVDSLFYNPYRFIGELNVLNFEK